MTSEKTLPDLPDFDAIADLMISEGALTLSPAELHGLMVGQLSAGARFDTDTLLRVLSELMNINQLVEEEGKLLFVSLYTITLAHLLDEDLGFQLLLPDDEQDISQRVDALSSWCSGFLAGFGMYLGELPMSEALKEGLQDFSEIAQVSTDPDELHDEDESGLLELQEYVRMAALYIFAECNPDVDPDPADKRKQLH